MGQAQEAAEAVPHEDGRTTIGANGMVAHGGQVGQGMGPRVGAGWWGVTVTVAPEVPGENVVVRRQVLDQRAPYRAVVGPAVGGHDGWDVGSPAGSGPLDGD